MQETLVVPVLMYGSKAMLWKEKKKSRIRDAQINIIKGLVGIRRVNRVPNAWIREFYGVTKGVDDRIDEGVLHRFGHVERMQNDRIGKRVYVGECFCIICILLWFNLHLRPNGGYIVQIIEGVMCNFKEENFFSEIQQMAFRMK